MKLPLLTSVRLALALDLVERVAVLALLGHFAWRILLSWFETGDPVGLILLASEVLIVFLCLIRRLSAEMSARPADWILATLGTVTPLLVVPIEGHALAPAAFFIPLMLAGVCLQIAAKLTLRRSFGLVAANRGIKIGGPYRLIRHPMYAGYLMIHIGFLMANPSLWNVAIYSAAFVFQVGRILAEEKILSRDAAYRDFVRAVPYWFIPRIV